MKPGAKFMFFPVNEKGQQDYYQYGYKYPIFLLITKIISELLQFLKLLITLVVS